MIDRNDVNKNRIYWKRKQKLNKESKNYHLCWDSNFRPHAYELAIVTTAPEKLLYCLLVSFIINQYFVR